jgi:hypothetical protein
MKHGSRGVHRVGPKCSEASITELRGVRVLLLTLLYFTFLYMLHPQAQRGFAVWGVGCPPALGL